MSDTQKRVLSIAEWHALAQQGTVLPMHIQLDGVSMQPLVRRNRDYVLIMPLSRPLKTGDVVMFEYPKGRYVAHRLRRIDGDRVQTLGDNCRNPDPWMPKSCVLGQVLEVERGRLRISLKGRMSRFLGRVWMAGLPVRRFYWSLRSLAGRALRKLGLRK